MQHHLKSSLAGMSSSSVSVHVVSTCQILDSEAVAAQPGPDCCTMSSPEMGNEHQSEEECNVSCRMIVDVSLAKTQHSVHGPFGAASRVCTCPTSLIMCVSAAATQVQTGYKLFNASECSRCACMPVHSCMVRRLWQSTSERHPAVSGHAVLLAEDSYSKCTEKEVALLASSS